MEMLDFYLLTKVLQDIPGRRDPLKDYLVISVIDSHVQVLVIVVPRGMWGVAYA